MTAGNRALDKPVSELPGAVGSVSDQSPRDCRLAQQLSGADQIIGVAGGDCKGQRPATVPLLHHPSSGEPWTWVLSIAAEEPTPLDPVSMPKIAS